MKMKYALLTSAMMAVGMVGVASAGGPPPPAVACNDDPVEVCMNGDLVEVELKCQGPDELAEELYVDGGLWTMYGGPADWGVYVALFLEVEGDGDELLKFLCAVNGYHDLTKTEGKCTEQEKGPTKGNKNHDKGGFDGYAVDYELKTVVEDSPACAD